MDTAPSPRIALVSEGASDHAVLRNFLGAYFDDPKIPIRQLQPPPNVPGGWTEVLRYLASPEFAAAFVDNDLVVVQIDTDVCEETGYDVSRRGDGGRELSPDELADRVQARLTTQIPPDVLAVHADRILFAVCVDSLECWLLPLVYGDRRQSRTANCLRALNDELSARHGFSIDPAKKLPYTERLLAKFRCHKHASLAAIAARNPSLTRFIARLDERFPDRAMLSHRDA